MRLRKPCEHGRYEEHETDDAKRSFGVSGPCPGGEFLPDDVLIIDLNDPEQVNYALEELDAWR